MTNWAPEEEGASTDLLLHENFASWRDWAQEPSFADSPRALPDGTADLSLKMWRRKMRGIHDHSTHTIHREGQMYPHAFRVEAVR